MDSYKQINTIKKYKSDASSVLIDFYGEFGLIIVLEVKT